MMFKRSISSFFIAAVVAGGMFFSGCEETTTPVTPTTPNAPTGVMGLSVNDSTVRLKWTASTSESQSDFKDYLVTATGGSATLNYLPLAKGVTMADFTGLTPGTKYTFSIVARTTATTNSTSTAATIDAAGAKRFMGVKVYETLSSAPFGSGLNLATGTSLTLSNATQWDLCLDTRLVSGADNVAFGTPGGSTYTDGVGKFLKGAQAGQQSKATALFSKTADTTAVITAADSLNQIFDTQAIGTGQVQAQNMAENLELRTKGGVIYAKTLEGNYAKIYIKAMGGKVLQGTSPSRYVEVDYSYQTAVNVPHALTTIPVIDNPRIIKIRANGIQ